FIVIAAIIFAACTLLATLASLRLHRIITTPVKDLAHVAARVQETRDYSLRATSRTNDELGLLTHAFNEMLHSVEVRDAELEQHRTNLSRMVDERTAELKRRTEEMRLVFDTVDQGFVTIDRAGRMANERSARFDAWFDPPAPEATLGAHLSRRVPGFDAMLQLSWDQVLEGLFPLDVAIDQLPKRLSFGERVFSIQYTPMMKGAEVDGALVAVTDITQEVEADRHQAAQRELVAAISRLVADRSSFIDFLEETERLVGSLSQPDAQAVARALHTIKGTASIFGVESVAKVCHELEDQLEQGERPEIEQRVRAAWSAFLERVRPFVGDDEDRVHLSRRELHRLADELEPFAPAAASTLRHWTLEAVEPRLKLLAQRGEVLAQRLGKAHVRFEVQDHGVRLHREPSAKLWGALVHLVRNALDHGVEEIAERVQAGKREAAVLSFTARSEAGTTVLEFSDDGRGIDWERVARKAGLQNPTRQQLVEVLFSDGFSTRDAASETSGRGVGLSAVADVVRELGGQLELDSTPGRGTTFRLTLPEPRAPLKRAA
ncbi:MAG: ATP-binding protein, partial [Myxococcota bacterium]